MIENPYRKGGAVGGRTFSHGAGVHKGSGALSAPLGMACSRLQCLMVLLVLCGAGFFLHGHSASELVAGSTAMVAQLRGSTQGKAATTTAAAKAATDDSVVRADANRVAALVKLLEAGQRDADHKEVEHETAATNAATDTEKKEKAAAERGAAAEAAAAEAAAAEVAAAALKASHELELQSAKEAALAQAASEAREEDEKHAAELASALAEAAAAKEEAAAAKQELMRHHAEEKMAAEQAALQKRRTDQEAAAMAHAAVRIGEEGTHHEQQAALQHNQPPEAGSHHSEKAGDENRATDVANGSMPSKTTVGEFSFNENRQRARLPAGYHNPYDPKGGQRPLLPKPTAALAPIVCDGSMDPFEGGAPVESFTPPAGAQLRDKAAWKEAVNKMMSTVRATKVGGSALAKMLQEEVADLSLLRVKLFCEAAKTAQEKSNVASDVNGSSGASSA